MLACKKTDGKWVRMLLRALKRSQLHHSPFCSTGWLHAAGEAPEHNPMEMSGFMLNPASPPFQH